MNDLTKNFVLLSYSHKDKVDLTKLVNWFDDNGYNLVYDKNFDLGDDWADKFMEFVDSVKCVGVLTVMSQCSIASKAVLKEQKYTADANKPQVTISIGGNTFEELFNSLTKDEDKDVAIKTRKHFTSDDIFCLLDDAISGEEERFPEKLKKWGCYKEENEDNIIVPKYTSELEGEKERLELQADVYVNFDQEAISYATQRINKDKIVVLDLGCSNGRLTRNRFSGEQFSRVIGIDINPKDIAEANELTTDSKFSFFTMDVESSDFIRELQTKLKELEVEKVDLVFSAFTLHHLKDPNKLLESLFRVFSPEGQIILRETDDDGKICYPDNDLLHELLSRFGAMFNKAQDRYNGRKLYGLLCNTGYENVKMLYDVSDTCEMGKFEKDNYIKIGFDFRVNRLNIIKKENPDNAKLIKEVKWQLDAIDRITALFGRRDFWYCITSYIAIAGVRK